MLGWRDGDTEINCIEYTNSREKHNPALARLVSLIDYYNKLILTGENLHGIRLNYSLTTNAIEQKRQSSIQMSDQFERKKKNTALVVSAASFNDSGRFLPLLLLSYYRKREKYYHTVYTEICKRRSNVDIAIITVQITRRSSEPYLLVVRCAIV